jgi:FKBP-type peptidyl-prolyl cis-trans isomerase FklB
MSKKFVYLQFKFYKQTLMKKLLLSTIVLVSVSITLSAQTTKKVAAKTTTKTAKKTVVPGFKNLLDSFSYAAGFNVATNMQAQGISKLNTEMMRKGMEDVFKKNQPLLTSELINASVQKQIEIFNAEKSAADKSKGKVFLEANKKRPGVITLPSGVQYEVVKNGDANSPSPKAVDTVVVNYAGTFIDGIEFDNTFKSGKPAILPVNNFIKGWAEILQMMRKGDHWKVFIPTELAYDAAGAGQAIPPYAALVFDMVLEDIKPVVK